MLPSCRYAVRNLVFVGVMSFSGLSLVVLDGCNRTPPTDTTPLTFNKDIAPILFANCATCHRPGQPVPFELLTYADAAKHGRDA